MNANKTYTLNEANRKAERDNDLRKLADRTVKWAREKGCYRDAESNEILGCFVVGTPAKGSHKPSWSETFDEDPAVWTDVLFKMLELGIPICYATGIGHFIGLPGEQGTKLATGINNVVTRIETAKRQLEAIIMSGQWGSAAAYLQGHLREDMRDVDLPQLLTGFDEFFIKARIPTQYSFAHLFVAAWMHTPAPAAPDNTDAA